MTRVQYWDSNAGMFVQDWTQADITMSDAFDIIRMVVQNRRQEEISDFLGITQSAVSRKIRKIRTALQQTVQY